MRTASLAGASRFARFLSTQNPFYVLSAVVVLYGLHQCSEIGGDWTGGGLLMGALAAYTLLLAGSAWMIVRLGRVWDDARTILLVLILLFLAISVSFDRVALANPLTGGMFLALGLFFVVTVTEGVLLALKLPLPACYRVPYYLLMLLLFSYPVLLSWASVSDEHQLLAWGVYLFPAVGSVTLLTLLPAARWGHRFRTAANVPWKWPLYPWTLFVLLWITLGLRSYSLSFSFEAPAGWHPDFQPHFLMPLVMAAALILFELATATGNRWARGAALVLPVTTLPLALVQLAAADGNTEFFPALYGIVGGPAFVAAWALVGFYTMAWLRGTKRAEAGLIAALFLAGFIERHALAVNAMIELQPIPLAVLAFVLIGLGIWSRKRWKILFGGAVALITVVYRHEQLAWEFATLHRSFYLIHAIVLLGLLSALTSSEAWARRVQKAACVLLPLASWTAAISYDELFANVAPEVQLLYLLGLAVIAWGFWCEREEPRGLVGATLTSISIALLPAKRMYLLLQATVLAKALPWLGVGLLLLVLALLISFYKGGVLARIGPLIRRVNALMRGFPA